MRILFSFFCMILVMANTGLADTHSYKEPYDALLKQHVTAGLKGDVPMTLVDYGSWSQDVRHMQAMQALIEVNPDSLSGKDKLAFWINAYNLLTIDLIIKNNEKESIKNLGSTFKNVWKSHKWKINGNKYTLDEIEHEILRPLGDPRIHMAINCASVSCPDLRNETYHADNLDRQLQEQTIVFLHNDKKGISTSDDTMQVSKIFEWFEEDFGGEDGVKNFIAKHLPETKNKTISGHLDYDWSLNGSW